MYRSAGFGPRFVHGAVSLALAAVAATTPARATDCTNYALYMPIVGGVAADVSCPPECPEGAVQEGEPVCHEGYVDTYDPGCATGPHVFRELECSSESLTVCGNYGSFLTDGIYRNDEDWYSITLNGFGTMEACVQADGRPQLAVFRGTCDRPVVLCDVVADACGRVCCQPVFAPGRYLVLVRPWYVAGLVPCAATYRLELRGLGCVPFAVQAAEWGRVKGLYAR